MHWTKAASRRAAMLSVTALLLVALAFLAYNVAKDGHADVIEGDGRGYYAWTRSILLDGDVDFTAEQAAGVMAPGREPPRTPKGYVANKYFVGLALVEVPPVFTARAVTALLGLGDSEPPGYSNAYDLAVAFWLLALGFAGVLVMVRRTIASACGDGFAVALLVAGTLGATNLIEYVTRCLSFTHLIDVATGGVLWAIADREKLDLRGWLVGGLLAGLLVILRPTSVVVLPWIAAVAFARGHRPDASALAVTAVGAALPVAVQLAVNLAHWGSVLPEPYPGERFDFGSPRLVDVLATPERGWLFWHPWFAVLLAILVVRWRALARRPGDRLVVAAALGATSALWIVNAAWHDWHFGLSFGNRGFLALVPVLFVTAARVVDLGAPLAPRTRLVAAAAVALLIAWNAWLWVGYEIVSIRGRGLQPTYLECVRWATTRPPAS